MTTSSSSSPIADFSSVEALYPQLQKRAYWMASKWGLDADDLAQSMALRLCEKIAAGALAPAAPADQLLAHGYYEASHLNAGENVYRRYVAEDILVDSDGGSVSMLDLLPDPAIAANPEARVVRIEGAGSLARRVRQLSADNRQVVKWLLVGYSKKEIAAKLGSSRSALSHRLETIASHLQ